MRGSVKKTWFSWWLYPHQLLFSTQLQSYLIILIFPKLHNQNDNVTMALLNILHIASFKNYSITPLLFDNPIRCSYRNKSSNRKSRNLTNWICTILAKRWCGISWCNYTNQNIQNVFCQITFESIYTAYHINVVAIFYANDFMTTMATATIVEPINLRGPLCNYFSSSPDELLQELKWSKDYYQNGNEKKYGKWQRIHSGNHHVLWGFLVYHNALCNSFLFLSQQILIKIQRYRYILFLTGLSATRGPW